MATLKGYSNAFATVAFSPDGKMIASSGWGGSVQLWDTSTRLELTSLKGHSEAVLSVAFSPDGRLLASASADTTVRLWMAATKEEVAVAQSRK